MALRQLKFALKDPKKNTSYRMQILGVETKYLHWQEETALYPISQDASNLTVKVLHNGNMYIRCTGGVFTPLGVKIK